MGSPPRRLIELSRPESLRLLAGVPSGRIVYTVRALPAIVPVHHLLAGDVIVARTHVAAECVGAVVAYQADSLGPDGWMVTITGVARPIADAAQIAGYEAELSPLVDAPDVAVIQIYPEIVTGFRLV